MNPQERIDALKCQATLPEPGRENPHPCGYLATHKGLHTCACGKTWKDAP